VQGRSGIFDDDRLPQAAVIGDRGLNERTAATSATRAVSA
jgi:hypothetical protein